MKAKFTAIAKNYLGMTPKEKGFISWKQMQEQMVSELLEAANAPDPFHNKVGSVNIRVEGCGLTNDNEFNMHQHWRDEPKSEDDGHGGTIKHFQ